MVSRIYLVLQQRELELIFDLQPHQKLLGMADSHQIATVTGHVRRVLINQLRQPSPCAHSRSCGDEYSCLMPLYRDGKRVLQAIVFSIPLFGTLTGCSTLQDIIQTEEVKPWQRGSLARDDMQLTTDVMHQSVDDHIYFSKEASTGGSNVQGGGCGCN